jgi:siroheme decarboxylase
MGPDANVNSRLLLALQKGLPVESRPFAAIGRDLGLPEAAVLSRVHSLFESGVARRFGAVFDSRSLGYESTLCAVDVPGDDLVAAVARIVPHPGITHCYERAGHPNLWFTMTALGYTMERELARVGKALGPYPVLNLPALKKYKIEAVFGHDARPDESRMPAPTGAETDGMIISPPTAREQKVVRCLQRSIPVVRDPFGEVAREADYQAAELLELVRRWRQNGVIRRIALVVRHHMMGFAANSMCVWKVAPELIEQVGCSMAGNMHVTHCYERPLTPAFPYNLYAMIHAKSREEAVTVFEALGRNAGVSGGHMMWSVREFKKSSPVFFCEPTPDLGEAPI